MKEEEILHQYEIIYEAILYSIYVNHSINTYSYSQALNNLVQLLARNKKNLNKIEEIKNKINEKYNKYEKLKAFL